MITCDSTQKSTVRKHFDDLIRHENYLDDGRIIWQSSLERGHLLGRLADPNVLDVRAAENDVLVDFVPGSDRAVRGPVLRAERTD